MSGASGASEVRRAPVDRASDPRPRLLEQMLRIRRLEEKCAELYRAGSIRGFLHLYIGEEAVAVGVMDCLHTEDAVVATYREHGHALARGVSAESILAEMYGKLLGTSRGRGGSMHLFDAATRFFGGNAIVGGGLPIAVGLALADAMQRRERVTACFFGEGAMAEGEFHESMNLAALWNLPVLFCCENNLYAMGTALARSESQIDLCVKAASYAMPAWSVDGMDVCAVRDAAERALVSIRAGAGPVFLELRTYRFRAHSMFDSELYREKSEVELWKLRDPIEKLRADLTSEGLLDGRAWLALEAAVEAEIAQAVAFAETAELEPVEELTRFVVSDRSASRTPAARAESSRKGESAGTR
jgi:pyruvate dehydrogenase E1 component alpha subunit